MAKPDVGMIGRVFECLTVLEQVKSARSGRMFLCQCECGNKKICRAGRLKDGTAKTCGCKLYSKRKTLEKDRVDVLWRSRYNGKIVSQERKKDRNYCDLISFEHFKKLGAANCFYCGDPPTKIYKDDKSDAFIFCGGVDRVDPSMGYWTMNVVPCCEPCNLAKGDLSALDFVWLSKNVANGND